MSASFALSALVAGLATGDCALPGTDCDGNGLQDACEMANNPLLDCDANLVLDVCDLQDAGLDLIFRACEFFFCECMCEF